MTCKDLMERGSEKDHTYDPYHGQNTDLWEISATEETNLAL